MARTPSKPIIKAMANLNTKPNFPANVIPFLPWPKKVIAHARSKGFHVVESEIKHDDADLKFKRGKQELDVSIEDKGQGRIEYKAEFRLGQKLNPTRKQRPSEIPSGFRRPFVVFIG